LKKQKKQELTEEQKSELLHKLLFKDKVEKLGDLNIEHHVDYVVVDRGSRIYQKCDDI
jgi:hypothetical protein